ncbi:MAG TPA: cytochrome c [Thermoanaerobaculia bacterium]|nr:cytochrome c [Thermoanaerobaculia bacterium]HUM29044.1 cytochrome c [Thermoanaerobaculia bacterium]HXK67400.1 cytochrome c [Thermoanaerobaculia bacterium]
MRQLRFLLIVLMVLGVAFAGLTAEGAKSGKELFKSKCRACHGKESKDGEFTPLTYIQDQWTRFFERKYTSRHDGLLFPDTDQKVLDVVTEEELQKIREFLVDHAADSEQPETCG